MTLIQKLIKQLNKLLCCLKCKKNEMALLHETKALIMAKPCVWLFSGKFKAPDTKSATNRYPRKTN